VSRRGNALSVIFGAALGAALGTAACKAADPHEELEVRDVETYWAIDPSASGTHYMAPVLRFKLHNRRHHPQGSIQATATFKRKGEESLTWGSDWRQITTSRKPLAADADVLVELKSDARYYSTGTPESMFQHELFKDASVEAFLRVGSSGWVSLVKADIDRRVGSKSVQDLVK
jgi:hypothetical protein